MARASAIFEDAALAGGIVGATYFGINTGDPGTTGANEVTGGGYARQGITWGTPSGGTVANATSALSVPIPSGNTVSYFSTWDALSSGNYQIGGALSATIDFVTAGTLTVAVGGLTIAAS